MSTILGSIIVLYLFSQIPPSSFGGSLMHSCILLELCILKDSKLILMYFERLKSQKNF